jgi:hypothetical protein
MSFGRAETHEDDFVKFQQYLTLGMQASKKHKAYETLARLEPGRAKQLFILKNFDKIIELFKGDKPLKAVDYIVFNIGVIEGLNRFGELTHLSMIVGDQTKGRSAKDVRAKLNRLAGKTA